MARETPEWIGKTDNTKAPPRVRQRIFDRDKGVCHLCRQTIKVGETWEADHVIALINGGSNREANISPAHSHCHVGKTVQDVKEKAKVAKVRGKHFGSIKPKSALSSPKLPKPALTKTLPPRRSIYQERT